MNDNHQKGRATAALIYLALTIMLVVSVWRLGTAVQDLTHEVRTVNLFPR